MAVWLDIGWLNEPKPYLLSLGPWIPAGMTALLALDIVLPIPGSVLMILSGHLYGVVLGAGISFLGMITSSILGYFIGYLVPLAATSNNHRAKKFIEQWGDLAVLLSRPIPVLSESVVILAGVERLSFKKVLGFCAMGWLPTCIIYASIGAFSFSSQSNFWGFIVVVAMSLVLFTWKALRRRTLTASKAA